ncbi:hypothetical protein [Arenibacter catalasegens]|nr:hypothetical protein [Arenibacter catalasegens]
MEAIKAFEISFSPDWYGSGYYVYVLKVVHNEKGTFYYIGQTGDRHFSAARSPFYRLMAHFNPYNSKATDAQLRNGLIAHGLIEEPTKDKKTRVCMEEAISSGALQISSVFYKILEFNGENHKQNRKHVEAVETALINLFDKKNLFNNLEKIGHHTVIINQDHHSLARQIYYNVTQQE